MVTHPVAPKRPLPFDRNLSIAWLVPCISHQQTRCVYPLDLYLTFGFAWSFLQDALHKEMFHHLPGEHTRLRGCTTGKITNLAGTNTNVVDVVGFDLFESLSITWVIRNSHHPARWIMSISSISGCSGYRVLFVG